MVITGTPPTRSSTVARRFRSGRAADPDGIHSHKDSVIHIHPFNSSATGADAQMSVLLEAMFATVTPEAITTREAGTISAADGCGDQAAVIKVARYAVDPEVELISVFDDDFGSIPFLQNREAFVIAKVPAGEDRLRQARPRSSRLMPRRIRRSRASRSRLISSTKTAISSTASPRHLVLSGGVP